MALPSDSIDLLAEFAAEKVEYLLVGGQAVALHGRAELIRLERASGRPQDLVDADQLQSLDDPA